MMETNINHGLICKLGGIALLGMLFLSSCVYDKEFAYLNDQIIALNKRVTKLQESVDKKLGSDLEASLRSVHARQAEVGTEIDQLKREVGGLSGRVEDNERLIKRAVERDLGEQDAVRSGLAQLSEKVSALELQVRRQREYLGLKPVPVQEGQEQVGAVYKERPPGPRKQISPQESKSEETAIYENALASFKRREFGVAIEGFKRLLERYPGSELADNAHFWIGECYMALKQYERAILAYQEVIKRYPKGNKVPGAMLRQALAFLEIKDKTSTRLLLKKIIKKYPKSSEAEIAQEKLKTLR